MQLDCATGSCLDFVEIRQPSSSENSAPRRFCCDEMPEDFTSEDSFLIVRFFSRATEDRGYKLQPNDQLGFSLDFQQGAFFNSVGTTRSRGTIRVIVVVDVVATFF